MLPKTNGWKVALIKAAGAVVVALLGLAGAYLGYRAKMATAANTSALAATVDQINDRTLPALDRVLVEMRHDSRALAASVVDLRERLARIEGRLDRRHRPTMRPTSHGRPSAAPKPEPEGDEPGPKPAASEGRIEDLMAPQAPPLALPRLNMIQQKVAE